MKVRYLFILLFIAFNLSAISQIVISQSDIPMPGDTMTRKTTSNLQGIDPDLTGADYTWDFTTLTPSSSKKDSFLTVSATPVEYSAVFDNPSDTFHKASVSLLERFFNSISSYVTLSDGYNYFKMSGNKYVQVGAGAKINGTRIPFSFDSLESIYSFPITYGTTDSSLVHLGNNITGSIYLGEKRNRKGAFRYECRVLRC